MSLFHGVCYSKTEANKWIGKLHNKEFFICTLSLRLRVFENRVLRRIFGSKRDEMTGCWRKLHNEELHSLYSSPSIIRMIKSMRKRWAGHIARMEKRGVHILYWWESQKVR
jgi:hypothetical protein